MITIKDLSEPSKAFAQIKEAHHQNVVEYFDRLIKESHTDVEANKKTCEKYYQQLKEIEDHNKLGRKTQRKKSLLKFLMILCFITIILIPLGIFIRNKIKNEVDKKLENIANQIKEIEQQADATKAEAVQQTNALNALYDWNTPAHLVQETLPLIQMDQKFDNKRFYHLHDKFNYQEHKEHDVSTVYVQSGSILGNPFVIETNKVQEMMPFTYTGTLVIHYTTYVSDGKGHSRAVHHTQTLIAHVVKPKPVYTIENWLVYGNEAAPKLTFTRMPTNSKGLSDRDITKLIKKSDKQLNKQLKKDQDFTKMGNSEFEALFKTPDRDNEVEYRLLFTPLAQKNMIDLIKMNQPYGDDFMFAKQGCLNYIKTGHAQSFSYEGDPSEFLNFDVTLAREHFIDRCDEYMQSFYFDLAPLLSIPLYQNYKAREYIYRDNHKNNVTSFETESLANAYDPSNFMPKESATDAILKSTFVKKDKEKDLVNITAYGFKSIPRVEMVPTLGGDGRMHMVPVTWYEYLPVKKETPFIVQNAEPTLAKYKAQDHKNIFGNNQTKDIYYQKGLVSAILHISRKGE